MANGPPPAPIGTVGVGYAVVDETVDEIFDVTTDDFDVVVEHFVEVDDAFVVVVLFFVVETRL